jgi:hypothetical protein
MWSCGSGRGRGQGGGRGLEDKGWASVSGGAGAEAVGEDAGEVFLGDTDAIISDDDAQSGGRQGVT